VIQHTFTYSGYESFQIMNYDYHDIPQFPALQQWSLPLVESVIGIMDQNYKSWILKHCIFIQVGLYWDQCTGWIKANRSFGMSRHKLS